MRRRDFIRMLTTASVSSAALEPVAAQAQATEDDGDLNDDVDPYFLDTGELSDEEYAALIEVEQLQERIMRGQPVAIPRGLRPARAPTYSFVHWSGDIGDRNGEFTSPLSVAPQLGALSAQQAYRVNAQILGFHGAGDDWRGRTNQGTLTVELRARNGGEQMTWFFAQQFEMDDAGRTNVGFEYVAQRNGSPEPLVTNEPNIAMRIQLMRSPRRSGIALRKIIKTALVVTGLPLQLENQDLQSTLQYLPPVRAPAMLQEGAALAQAMVGGTAEETPIWRGGFNSYAIAAGGSQLSLRPGYWMAIDAGRAGDLRDVSLNDLGGFVGPSRDGEPLDVNYLVFAFEINTGPAPGYFNYGANGAVNGLPQQSFGPNDSAPRAVPKSVPR